MCTGIALAASDVPLDAVERYSLSGRLHERGGEREYRFLFRDKPRLLPIIHDGQFQIVRWGRRRGEAGRLPCTGWTWLETLEKGTWQEARPEEVQIPATMGLENGRWFAVREGIRGLVVADERGELVAYMLCEPASHYYEVMTRSKRMPVLVNERI
jgi:hypothetical protein